MLSTANIRLHKVASNSVEVITALPEQDRETKLRELNLYSDPLPTQRSLGVCWDLENDAFTFQVLIPSKPYTRRGVLAVVNSVYDALGFLTTITLKRKMLLRKLVELGNKKHVESPTLGWDDPLPASLNREWEHWRSALIHFKNVLIPRCYHGK
jgi:hypothetical protein